MKRTFAGVLTAAVIGGFATAQAQVVVPPGQEFYGTPTAKDMPMTMPMSKIKMDAPAKPMMKKKMMKKKMMKKKM